ncbi:putative short-chain dehydrogenase reductase protein [Phaeoacremonium minimum UCRPA7]|uniref:Putative short-chain dehydrogenase reductase protein n=1 Tax=Phaeoacremonium minimum (strain UCR-PA7) TaxID=1286976 RepID=R8BNB3_PHAM7|nr:putative short-chain dehydrogenase reductase protein [Phaeoacremonium minimum UCRPA7]EOO00785.1 putative short-chain dehydrogenase reductase protein [Phaeoacremonium minimum UCRPA7]
MASLLKGTAFITGAASGIGRATAVSFARFGIQRLALADINEPALKASNEELRQQFSGVEVLDLTMDVQDTAQVSSSIAEAVRAFGRLDVAVNNAGTGGAGEKTHELPESEWNRIVGINLNGVWRCQREELGVMLKQE